MGGSEIQAGSGESLGLETVIDVINPEGIEVYAVITPPAPGETEGGGEFETPVLQQIKVDLAYQGETEEKGYFGRDKIFSGQSPALSESGIYELTFYMKDATGELTSSGPVMFQVGEGQPGLTLASGWNLLSLPVVSTDSSVEVVLSEIKEDIASAWKWENGKRAVYLPSFTLKQLNDYITSKGFEILFNIECGEGFWVNSNTDQDLTVSGTQPLDSSHFLSSGWNLIGLKSNETKSISTVISSNENNIASIWKWINPPGKWAVYLPKDDSDKGLTETQEYATSKAFSLLQQINPGEGFWVNATQPVEVQ